MRTGPSNPQLKELLTELRTAGFSGDKPVYRRILMDLERPTRQRRIVNISRLNRHTEANDVVIIPGKLLSSGELDHQLTVVAFKFSNGAAEKVHAAKGKAVTLTDFIKQNPDLKKVKIIG